MRFCSPSTPSLWRGGTVEAWASQDLQDRICGSLPLIPRARPKGGTARGRRGSQHAIRLPHLRTQIFRNSSADRFIHSPAPDRREEQRGGGGGASMRSAYHIFDRRRRELSDQSPHLVPLHRPFMEIDRCSSLAHANLAAILSNPLPPRKPAIDSHAYGPHLPQQHP